MLQALLKYSNDANSISYDALAYLINSGVYVNIYIQYIHIYTEYINHISTYYAEDSCTVHKYIYIYIDSTHLQYDHRTWLQNLYLWH